MRAALREARRGLGRTRTNPLVGAVLARNGTITRRGSHRRFGGPHAERDLLQGIDHLPDGTTMACTLEPCVHQGKTPPCVDRLLEVGLERLILASRDPDPNVDGAGIQRLREHGVRVEVGCQEVPYRWLNRAFFYRQATGYPYLEVKLALTANGRIATRSGHSQWITGEASRNHGHRLRSRCDAVMVGAETLRQDDPRLTDRVTGRPDQPRALVVARQPGRLPEGQHLFTERASETVLMLPEKTRGNLPKWLRDRPVEILFSSLEDGTYVWSNVLTQLLERGLGRILVEGGGRLVGSLLEAGVVPEWHLFYSGRLLGPGRESMVRDQEAQIVDETADTKHLTTKRLGNDQYVRRADPDRFQRAGFRQLPEPLNQLPEEVR